MSQIFLTNTATTDHIYKLIIGLQTAVIEMHARLQELEGKGTSLVGKSLSPLLAQVSISNSTLLGVVPNHPPPARSSTTSTSTNAVASTSTLADNILPAPPILPASPVPPAPPIRPAKQPPRPRPRPALVPPPRAICPPSLAQRLSTTPLAIALSPTLRERAFPTAVLTNLFGGNPNKGRTRPRAHHAARTGCDHFFYLRPAHQPYVPALPGQPGVLLSATPREASWQEYERVLVQSGRGNGREAQWMYMGQYELFSGKPLTVPEVCALPQAVLEFWARYFHRSPGSKPVRMRIWFRKMHGRLPTPQEREIFIKEPEKRSEKISVGEIVSALRQGAEYIYGFGMRCVFYEASFQLRLIAAKGGDVVKEGEEGVGEQEEGDEEAEDKEEDFEEEENEKEDNAEVGKAGAEKAEEEIVVDPNAVEDYDGVPLQAVSPPPSTSGGSDQGKRKRVDAVDEDTVERGGADRNGGPTSAHESSSGHSDGGKRMRMTEDYTDDEELYLVDGVPAEAYPRQQWSWYDL